MMRKEKYKMNIATNPSAGGRARLEDASSNKEKCAGVATNVYSWKTLEKPKGGLRILRIKGSGVVYVQGRY